MNPEQFPTIAIVDDHDRLRKEMSKVLTILGFEVILCASDGQDFLLKMATTERLPDICLLDINMPKMNGIMATHCIKTIWPQMKVLAFTFDSDQIPAALVAGADGCILKGSSGAMFKEKLLELCNNKSAKNIN